MERIDLNQSDPKGSPFPSGCRVDGQRGSSEPRAVTDGGAGSTKPKRRRFEPTPEQIEDIRRTWGLERLESVAERMGCHRDTLSNYGRNVLGLPLLGPTTNLTPELERIVREMTLEGYSSDLIADRLGFAGSTIRKWITRIGIKREERPGRGARTGVRVDWTPEMDAHVIAQRKAGKRYWEIGEEMGIHPATVLSRHDRLRAGTASYGRRPRQIAPRFWDEARRAKALALFDEGCSPAEIGTALGCGPGGVMHQLKDMGRSLAGFTKEGERRKKENGKRADAWTEDERETVRLAWVDVGGPQLAHLLGRKLEDVVALAAELGLPPEPEWTSAEERKAKSWHGKDMTGWL